MKVAKINDNTGRLLVVNSGGRLIPLDFPLDTIFKWYPLSSRYQYRYRTSTDVLYLALVHPSEIKPIRYKIKEAKGRAVSDVASFQREKWCNPEVVADNKKVFAFAKRLGIATPDKPYTITDVTKGISCMQDCLDTLLNIEKHRVELKYQKAVVRYAKKPNKKDLTFIKQYEACQKLDREDQTSFILDTCTHKTREVYTKLGDVYTMLSIMRKVVS